MDAEPPEMRLPASPEALAASDALNIRFDMIWSRRPQVWDHKGKLLQNAQLLATHLADGVVDMIGHVVRMTYDRYRVTEQLVGTPTQPMPLMPTRNAESQVGWDGLTKIWC